MFRSVTLFHTRTILSKDKAEDLIIKLHEHGISEIKEAEQTKELNIEVYDTLDEKAVKETQNQLNEIITKTINYREIKPPESMITQLINPKPPEKIKVDILSNEKIVKEVQEKLSLIKPKIEEKLIIIEKKKSLVEKNNYLIENLEALPNDFTNIFESTENINIQIGIVNVNSLDQLKEKVQQQNAIIGVKEKNELQAFIFVATTISNSQEIEKVLHEIGFESITIPFEKASPEKIMKKLAQENKTTKQEIRAIEAELKGVMKEQASKLDVLEEEIDISIQRIIAYEQLNKMNSLVTLEAWVPEENLEKFKSTIKKVCKEYYMEVEEKEEAPTKFDNHPLIQPFEIITELYSVPKYKQFDPTPVLAISFAVFFGYMLTDFFYGLVLLGIAVLMYKGMGKYNPGMKKFSVLLMWLGIFTALLGAFFKSYLGDFFPRIGIEMPGVLDPLSQVMEAIILSLAIAAVHLFIGLVIGYYENARKGKMIDALGQQGVWLFLLIGGIAALIGEGIFSTIGLGLIGLAVIIQLAYNYVQSGPIISTLSLFNISGFLGDVFSYARLTALAIGTAGIALAVNFMALMVVDMVPVVGIIFGIMIFIGGHIFNMVMNGLGAFIHALRLHFLEFFSKFYEGGGKLYKPFYALRKNNYTEDD